MGKIQRFGVSLDSSLLKKFDGLLSEIGYKSRSEAIRDLIRERLVSEEWRKGDEETIGILGLVYSHEKRQLAENLNRLQHKYLGLIISSNHIHLDKHNCLEVVILKGKGFAIKEVSDKLLSTKNVKHGQLLMTTTGKEIQ